MKVYSKNRTNLLAQRDPTSLMKTMRIFRLKVFNTTVTVMKRY
ncbi:hypothetical protein cypCar_00024503 [Cyprinus carpio]|nr:hypothetical protein cypCar_00024503 [Cyprinus carpio]